MMAVKVVINLIAGKGSSGTLSAIAYVLSWDHRFFKGFINFLFKGIIEDLKIGARTILRFLFQLCCHFRSLLW